MQSLLAVNKHNVEAATFNKHNVETGTVNKHNVVVLSKCKPWSAYVAVGLRGRLRLLLHLWVPGPAAQVWMV